MNKRAETDEQADQSARFIDAARELGCDESPDAFEAAVKKVARHKPLGRKPEDRDNPKQDSVSV